MNHKPKRKFRLFRFDSFVLATRITIPCAPVGARNLCSLFIVHTLHSSSPVATLNPNPHNGVPLALHNLIFGVNRYSVFCESACRSYLVDCHIIWWGFGIWLSFRQLAQKSLLNSVEVLWVSYRPLREVWAGQSSTLRSDHCPLWFVLAWSNNAPVRRILRCFNRCLLRRYALQTHTIIKAYSLRSQAARNNVLLTSLLSLV